MSLSKSDEILRELSRHPQPMSARQLATSISHGLAQTRALVSYMISSGKLEARGQNSDGTQTYSMTAVGRDLVKSIEGHGPHGWTTAAPATPATTQPVPAPPPAPAVTPAPAPAASQLAPIEERDSNPRRRAPDTADTAKSLPADRRQSDAWLPSIHDSPPPEPAPRARFGLLNSGELVIIAPNDSMIMLHSSQLDELRATLGDQP